jgi:CO/xanthine dehydrogenase Mo-binding subunit
VAQVESAAVYALSAMMKDAITVDRGRVQQANFNDYDMPRMKDMPKIEVHLFMSKEDPTGIGEPGLPVVAPAVGNAIFAATGKRLRRLPIRNEDLA